MNTRLFEILAQGSGRQGWLPSASPALHALHRMEAEGLDSLAVVDGSQVCGAVSRLHLSHCSNCLEVSCRSLADTPVHQVMNAAVLVARPEVGVRELLHEMMLHSAAYTAAMDGAEFFGLIPLSAVCAAVAQDLDEQVGQLTSYICGTPAAEDPAASQRPTGRASRAASGATPKTATRGPLAESPLRE